MLDGIEASFHPYVRDRGLDWEIHIEQVGLSVFKNLKATSAVALDQIGAGSWGEKFQSPLAGN